MHSSCLLTEYTHPVYSLCNASGDKISGKIRCLYPVAAEDRRRPSLTVRAVIYALGASPQYLVTDSRRLAGFVGVAPSCFGPEKVAARRIRPIRCKPPRGSCVLVRCKAACFASDFPRCEWWATVESARTDSGNPMHEAAKAPVTVFPRNKPSYLFVSL